MIQSIADHIHKNAPAYVVAIFIAGFGAFGSGLFAWYNLQRDLSLIKCKLDIEDNGLCRWTSTIAEDLAKAPEETTNTD